MKPLFPCCAGLLALALSACAATPTPAPAHKRVVIITGEDYPGHHWKETGPALKAELEKDPRLTVDLVEDVNFTRSPKMDTYDAVVLHFKNYNPKVPGREGFDHLKRFVENGGGLVSVHFACGAFEEFKDEYEQLIGRTWIGISDRTKGRGHHDAYGPFRVEMTDKKHPVTAGLPDFNTQDELYHCLEGEAPIHVLAESQSKQTHANAPQAFVRQTGKGRVFVSTLGHDKAAITNPGTAELFRRGAAYVAGLDPAPPVAAAAKEPACECGKH